MNQHSKLASRHSVRVGQQVDAGSYVDVAGVPVWHFHGGDPAGPPTVLLHGVFASAATWATQIGDLIDAGLHVYTPERSGHGHSPDTGDPFTLEAMTAQTIAYLDAYVDGPAHLVGWSDGAVVALLVARTRPDLVARMVTVCNYVNFDGSNAEEFFNQLTQGDADTVDFIRDGYEGVSPDGPEHFDTVYDKTLTMLRQEPNLTVEEFADVTAPTLVVAADCGIVHLEHSLALSRTLPHGRLAVLPGTHLLPVEAPELFNPMVVSFLAADPPSTWTL